MRRSHPAATSEGQGSVEMVEERTPHASRIVKHSAAPVPRLGLEVRQLRPAPILEQAPAVDLRIATIDVQGRVPLGKAATTMGWNGHDSVLLTVQDGIVRLVDPARLRQPLRMGISLRLDGRLRVQLPFGVRIAASLQPGMRLILLAASSDGVLAGLPVGSLIERLTGGL